MNTTIFNTPVLSKLFHYTTRFFLWILGWRILGGLPDLPKYVLIGAPHTSNWDFVLFLAVIFRLQANVSFMGKAELFRNPFGWFFYWCAGIPVDRSKSQGLVDQMVQACDKAKHFILVIAPEGTRHYAQEWKRGFYHIAKGAGIPIVLAIVQADRKSVEVGKIFNPTDDMEADMKTIQGFFVDGVGINPILTSRSE